MVGLAIDIIVSGLIGIGGANITTFKKSVFSGANTHVSTKKIILRVMVQDK